MLRKETGRILYDIVKEKFIEYYQVTNDDMTVEDPIEFPTFTKFSNRNYLNPSSTECLLNLVKRDG